LNTLFRSIGVSLASALCGSILATFVIHIGPVSITSLASYRWVFIICALGAAIAAALALGIPKVAAKSANTTSA
jgi:phage-related minor tail protein